MTCFLIFLFGRQYLLGIAVKALTAMNSWIAAIANSLTCGVVWVNAPVV
jgi:hypothetical protein